MTVLSSSKAAAIAAQIVEYEALLVLAKASYAEGLASSKKSYRLDTTEGSQSVTKFSLREQWDNIESIERAIEHMQRRLAGGLNVNMNVRRKQHDGMRGRSHSW